MEWARKNAISVATHGCPHHVDELVALSLLKNAVLGDIQVTFLDRTEIDARADQFDVLVDIGGQYDPDRGRFDHHQGGPGVEGRSSAGLVFDALYRTDRRYEYLKPIIDYVDAVDCGTVANDVGGETGSAFGRRRTMLSVSALLKAVGGFRHDPGRSRRCLELIECLVRSWLEQAEGYIRAEAVVAAAQRVGRGVLLDSEAAYGPGLLEFLQKETDIAFVGFPDRPGRFVVVAIRDAGGDNRVAFGSMLGGATFVHPKGFMAVFPNRIVAQRTLSEL